MSSGDSGLASSTAVGRRVRRHSLQAEFIALVRQRTAHAAEVLAAIEENVRILKLLLGWQGEP